MPETFSFTVTVGDRIDLLLLNCGKGISRRGAKRLLTEGRVAVEGKIVKVASRFVRPGDRVSVVEAEPSLVVLKETSAFIAIDKSPGLASQPIQDPRTPSALEIAGSYLRNRGQVEPLHVVHRLDTPASGVLLFARNTEAAAVLSESFRNREVTKVYLAVVDGAVSAPFEIDTPIEKVSESVSRTSSGGLDASTSIVPLATGTTESIVAAVITTGRMHQIRAHLASVGHPIRGDRKYGVTSGARLYLHAFLLQHESIGRVIAPIPKGFVDVAGSTERRQIRDEEILLACGVEKP